MNTTYTDNGNGTFTATTTDTQPFDPVATQTQITTLQGNISSLNEQSAALIALRASQAQEEAAGQFQPQIDSANSQIAALQTQLDAFNSQIPNPSQAS